MEVHCRGAAASDERQPVEHSATLMPTYFALIASGAKSVEGRIRAGMWLNVQPGDTIRFTPNAVPSQSAAPDGQGPALPPMQATEYVTVRATAVQHYDTFEAMLTAEGLSACLPGVGSIADGVEIYRSIPTYRERESAQHVIAVRIALLASHAS